MLHFKTKEDYNLVKWFKIGLVFLSLGLLLNFSESGTTTALPKQHQLHKTIPNDPPATNEDGTLVFTGEKQLYLANLDHLGRATQAHIQLQDAHTPSKKREPRLTYNPVGWHNYKFSYGVQGKKAWLMNRGHLVGYLFSGLNNEAKNLVPLTAWLNSGNYRGFDKGNPDGMLFYEKRLDSWLATHPNFWLDYRVEAIYQGEELLPRHIVLRYVGLDQNGQLIPINIGGKASQDGYGISQVTLENISPNASINYLTGQATSTPPKTTQTPTSSETPIQQAAPETTPPPAEQAPSPDVQQAVSTADPIVYIARKGNADVYWYSKDNMPSNTNFANIREVPESQAIAWGKRHTTKE